MTEPACLQCERTRRDVDELRAEVTHLAHCLNVAIAALSERIDTKVTAGQDMGRGLG